MYKGTFVRGVLKVPDLGITIAPQAVVGGYGDMCLPVPVACPTREVGVLMLQDYVRAVLDTEKDTRVKVNFLSDKDFTLDFFREQTGKDLKQTST